MSDPMGLLLSAIADLIFDTSVMNLKSIKRHVAHDINIKACHKHWRARLEARNFLLEIFSGWRFTSDD